MSTPSGFFIVVEGPDGAGTTTQAARLVEWLCARGEDAHLTREPSDGETGRLIRKLLGGDKPGPDALFWQQLALLFAADRLDHLDREVLPSLKAGRHVVSDRYLLSSLVYQGLNSTLEWVEAINIRAIEPDLTVLLDVPLEECAKRMAERKGTKEIFDVAEAQRRIHGRYKTLADRVDVVLDGTGPEDAVAERLASAVSTVL